MRTSASQDSTSPHTILALVVLATALSNLEVGLVNVALPTLADAFDAAPAAIQWVAIAYQLVIIGTLVPFGRLVDLAGGRAIYLAGMATVTLASILAALSPHLLWLIFARGLLGLGAAMLLATSQALVIEAYPDAERGRALGMMHMAVAGGLMAGPSVGGLLITLVGWRMIFLLPIVVTTLALGLGWRSLPRQGKGKREPIDLVGAGLIVATAIFAVVGLTGLTRNGDDTRDLLMLPAAVTLGVLFVVIERRQNSPLVDLATLRRWDLSAGLLAAFLTFIALASNMFLIPFALQGMMGHSAATAGVLMMTVPLLILPVAPLAGMLADRRGSRLPTTLGLTAICLAILGMARFDAETPVGIIIVVLGMYGLGAGLFQAPNNSAVLGAAPVGRQGVTSGMLALSRNLGQIVGILVASTVWTWREAVYREEVSSTGMEVLEAGLHDAFLVLASFGLLALLILIVRGFDYFNRESECVSRC